MQKWKCPTFSQLFLAGNLSFFFKEKEYRNISFSKGHFKIITIVKIVTLHYSVIPDYYHSLIATVTALTLIEWIPVSVHCCSTIIAKCLVFPIPPCQGYILSLAFLKKYHPRIFEVQ
jgi:hypothetical protein